MHTKILPEVRHISPGLLVHSCKASRINSTNSASSYSVGFSHRDSFLDWSLEPSCSWTGTELQCGEPKGSLAGKQVGCQAIGVQAGCLHCIESATHGLVVDHSSLI